MENIKHEFLLVKYKGKYTIIGRKYLLKREWFFLPKKWVLEREKYLGWDIRGRDITNTFDFYFDSPYPLDEYSYKTDTECWDLIKRFIEFFSDASYYAPIIVGSSTEMNSDDEFLV